MAEIIKYHVGYNFDKRTADFIREQNKSAVGACIESVYASTREFEKLTARPGYKLPDISTEQLKEHIKIIHDMGVSFSYPLNAPYIGKKREIEEQMKLIVDFINRLQFIGVDRVIVTHPIMAQIVNENSDLKISFSSIANIFSVNQISFLNELFSAKIYCLSPYFNRKVLELKEMQKKCKQIGCEIELIVNELCGLEYGGKSFSPCVFRDSCFVCHSENSEYCEEMLLGGFPQSLCKANRAQSSQSFWAKTMLIRPEDVKKYYTELGITRFKITGRTAKTEDLCAVISSYMNFRYDGEVAGLWYMENPGNSPQNNTMDGLIEYWFNKKINCDTEICGSTCKYCDEFMKHKNS